MEALPSQYIPGKTLGKGAYATVIEAIDKKTNTSVAVKLIKKTPSSLDKHAEFKAITAMHKHKVHPNAVEPIAL